MYRNRLKSHSFSWNGSIFSEIQGQTRTLGAFSTAQRPHCPTLGRGTAQDLVHLSFPRQFQNDWTLSECTECVTMATATTETSCKGPGLSARQNCTILSIFISQYEQVPSSQKFYLIHKIKTIVSTLFNLL